MKFFTYDLIASANGWGNETVAQQGAATRRFDRAVRAYERHLDVAKPKVPSAAWRFFRHGNPENTLHDARLVHLATGDSPERRRRDSAARCRFDAFLKMEFLTYGEDRLYIFDFKGVRRINSELVVAGGQRDLGDLYTYELRAAPHKRLAISFLFATGATIDIECEHLDFSVQDANKFVGLQNNRVQLKRSWDRRPRTHRPRR